MRAQEATLSFQHSLLVWGESREATPFLNHDTIYLPSRTKTLVQITVQNPTRQAGYVPRIQTGPGIFIGECLVTNRDGKASLFAINSTAEDVQVIMPPIILEPYDSTIKPVRTLKVSNGTEIEAEKQDRIDKIIELLNMAGLNQLERDGIIKLVSYFPCQFQLPKDKLSKTSKITHKIPTTDNIPINAKQYRYPPHLRDAVRQQVQDLINNDIVEESESPYNSPLWIVPKKPDSQGNRR